MNTFNKFNKTKKKIERNVPKQVKILNLSA